MPVANGVAVTPDDYIDAVAQWNGIDNLSDLAGQTVSLRFVMDDATVYSFHFEPAPEPSTLLVLLLCGGCAAGAARKTGRLDEEGSK